MAQQLPLPESELLPRLGIPAAHADFLASRQAQNVSARTLEYCYHQLDPFIAWTQETGIVIVNQVTTRTVRAYLVRLQEPISLPGRYTARRGLCAPSCASVPRKS